MAKVWNYGSKNGMATVVFAIRKLCHIYTAYSGAIIAYITTHVTDSTERATVLAFLNSASAVCNIIEATVQVTTES